jgi:hypothetical protein
MASAEDYERYAQHCLKMVEMADNREDRIIKREMGTEWLKLGAGLREAKAYPQFVEDIGAQQGNKVRKRG